jgi:adenosylcobalamin-dependent ribonucleoside-triphosphate reductase
MGQQSTRAQLIERRTYLRPLNWEGETTFETPAMALDRQIEHQRYLWEGAKQEQFGYLLVDAEVAHAEMEALLTEAAAADKDAEMFDLGMMPEEAIETRQRAKELREEAVKARLAGDDAYDEYGYKTALTQTEEDELWELRLLLETRKASLSGRVKWMAGTDVIKDRPAAAFNCSFTNVEIPADFVDIFWLLLQGCGVGFRPVPGLLEGFLSSSVKVEFIGSTRTARGGQEETTDRLIDGVWTITFGDSAKGWAKGVGKLIGSKRKFHTLIIDLSNLRPSGQRLRGYGWISSGWEPLRDGLKIITDVLSAKSGQRLNSIDIGDIVNALGTVLSSRRSAQIWLVDSDHPDVNAFIGAKENYFERGLAHRAQSNNSVAWKQEPPFETLVDILKRCLVNGEPGLYNLEAAQKRAPWARGCNPCAEILLPSKGFCNLVQIVWSRFNGDFPGLMRAHWIMARANYRQTCVSMRDGVLQLQWDDNNKLLRLCGVAPTGIIGSEVEEDDHKQETLKMISVTAANAMADELGSTRPALVTQVQPAGTSSKVLGEVGDEVNEGAHLSPSRFIFNNVGFSVHDPLVNKARDAGYRVFENPFDKSSVLVTFPVAYPASEKFKKVERARPDGTIEVVEINEESAIDQLERYKRLMKNYVQHNCSITVSFDEDEIYDIANWLHRNWDTYIGVSFLQRNDPSKTAADLGFPYLPQESVSEATYDEYANSLKEIDFSDDQEQDGVAIADCATGACPVK